ncbi:hypothetical protein [Photobacterium damselae]|uniref:hypothetical protein n=1 Tax=Photobacterium damselae TaxID=38293 RepID=UPI0009EFA04C|nr:hypothetical protein [Photobacterium damselae]MBE8130553.1 hypothetical protein [Photobacterium damselae subsp. piscicida]MBE8130562.1 hypothetical protein [Photobacterium damselae subsp. piscicida]GAW47180.1 hypothetical protein PDPJ_3_00001 [Photobacterium damselae subsp. piscicida]
MAIQLQQFLSVAKNNTVVANQNNQGEVTLKSGRFEGKTLYPFAKHTQTQSNLNLQTMGLFLNSLQKEYGSDITSHLASKLDITSGSKPLSGKVIQTIIGEANAIAISKAMTAFNAQAVHDFIASKLLANNDHEQWLDPNNAAGKQFEGLLHEACDKQHHQLTQREIAEIAQTVVDDIHRLPQRIQEDFNQVANAFNQKDHYQVLHNLDNCAQKIMLRAQFNLDDVDKQKLGADDNSAYQQHIVSELTQGLSQTQASDLLNSILNHPTSKELVQLINPPRFKMQVMYDLKQADIPYEDQLLTLTKLCRTETLLDALITELDKRAHGSDKASKRLNDWVSYYGQGIGAGEISASDPEFASAFLTMQANDNHLNLDDCGLTQEPVAAQTKQYVTLTNPTAVTNALKEIAEKVGKKRSELFEKDFDRATYLVDGAQISRNEDSTLDDISKIPTCVSYFANQELFASVLISLMNEQGISPIGDPTSTFNLYNKEDGTMELHAQLDMKLNKMIIGLNEETLDPDKSSLHLEVNLTIAAHNSQIDAKLNGPINVDYRADPL